MVSNTYRTGSWLGMVRSGSVIVLESNTDPDIVNRLWDFLGQDPTIHGVLNEVTDSFGTGLTGLPSFAILVQSDKLHAILRGDITLIARKDGAAELVSGRDVTTWSERSLTLPDALELTLAEPDSDTESDFDTESGAAEMELPVSEAVVRLQSLRLDISCEFSAAVPYVPSVPSVLPEVQEDETPEAATDVEHYQDAEPEDAPHTLAQTSADEVEEFGAQESAVSLVEEDSVVGVEQLAQPEDDAYASFAMAAEAADAEWSAQLEPVQANGEDDINDLDLTIRPDLHELDLHEPDLHEPDLHEEDAAAWAVEFPASVFAGDSDQEPLTHSESELQDAAMHAGGQAEAAQAQSTSDADTSEEPNAPAADSADESAFTTSTDHLWGPTVALGVDDGAVRLDEHGQPIEAVNAGPVVPPLPSLPPLTAQASLGADSTDTSPGIPWQDYAPNAGQDDAGQCGTEAPMIDSVPWSVPGAQNQHAPAAEEPFDPDHDGQTVMSADADRDLAPAVAAPLESRPSTGPMVLARMCLHGHANPPLHSQCSDCGALLNSEPREVGRPRLGTMHISSGESVELDHSLIIGRQPSVSRVMGGAMPRLVQVKSSNDDISRSHVEVRLDGWDVLLVDLKATNGTVLVREGQAPRRLSQGEQAILLNGDIAELGDGISLLFDGLL